MGTWVFRLVWYKQREPLNLNPVYSWGSVQGLFAQEQQPPFRLQYTAAMDLQKWAQVQISQRNRKCSLSFNTDKWCAFG